MVNLEEGVAVENTPDDKQGVTEIVGIMTKTGAQMQTRDFLADDDVVLFDEGAGTYLISEEQGVNNPLYQIFYFDGGGITISLQDEDLNFARARAETALQEKLGLSLLEMCSLQIRVTTPWSVSDKFSGRDLGLSFCPGAEVL